MMKKNILSLLAASLILAGCDYNDKHFDGLDDMSVPKDTKGIEYTLTDEDYATIANNKANKDLAKALDEKASTPENASEVYANALKAIASSKSFNELIPAKDFAPNFLITKWYTKDNTAAIKLAYNEDVNKPEILDELIQAKNFTFANSDYELVWGESGVNYLTDKKPLHKHADQILKANFADAEANQYAIVNYQYSLIEPGTGGGVDPVIFFEDFDEFKDKDEPAWKQQNVQGARTWQIRAFNNNSFLQYSANKSGAKEECYILTPSIKVKKGAFLSFDLKLRYYNGVALSIKVSDNYTDDVTTATWTDITSSFDIPVPAANGETDFLEVGKHDLSTYDNKNITVAFVYEGDGTANVEGAITTTVQIDNVKVSTEKASGATTRAASILSNEADVYQFNGTAWIASNKAIAPNADDYKAMGIKRFGKSADPKVYLPKYLSAKYPYATAEKMETIVYLFDEGLGADQYQYDGDKWNIVESFVPVTSQFVFLDGVWSYNPSTVVDLVSEKGNMVSTAFYQDLSDWVWVNIDQKLLNITEKGKGYVTKYGNNDYYYGGSAHNNNFDIRPGKYKEQYPEGYKKENGAPMEDKDISDLIMQRMPEALKIGLSLAYPDAVPVENMDVVYTVNFVTYDGANADWTIQFDVVGKADFQYIEGSLKKR